ncbi:MAG TPA: hypothetical protein VHN99_02355 [Deinococcales bacterium]|nr:hypothetical protein [Deinococcales bacterium]
MPNKTALLAALALSAGLALAAGAALKLRVNGQASATPALVVNGVVYVPLNALTQAGWKAVRTATSLDLNAPAAAGGANERASLEGCLGQTLFNGLWRLTVRRVDAISRSETVPGWGVTVELKNGSSQTVYASNTGVMGFSLIMPDGSSLEKDSHVEDEFLSQDLNPGAGESVQLKFYLPPNTANPPRPAKLLLEVDPARLAGFLKGKVGYTVPNPSFRVDLTCSK